MWNLWLQKTNPIGKISRSEKKTHGFCNSASAMCQCSPTMHGGTTFLPSTVPSGVEGCIRFLSRSGPNRPRNWINGLEEPDDSLWQLELATDPCSDIWQGSDTGNWSVPSPIFSAWSTGNWWWVRLGCCRVGCWVISCDCRPWELWSSRLSGRMLYWGCLLWKMSCWYIADSLICDSIWFSTTGSR